MPTIVGTSSEVSDKIKITLDTLDPCTVDTLAGDDTVTVYGNGNLSLLTGVGNDKVQNFASGTLTLKLGAGDDTFVSSTNGTDYSIDSVYAGQGNDAISTGHGDDWLFGGTGNDTLYLRHTGSGVRRPLVGPDCRPAGNPRCAEDRAAEARGRARLSRRELPR